MGPTGLLPEAGRRSEVAGIFNTGLYEFDTSTALASPSASAQKLFGLEGRVTYLQVKLGGHLRGRRAIGERIKEVLPPVVYITTWMELNKSLFSALKLEKNIMFLTITLIVIVAALNIIATLILMVMEKTRDIGILMAMGATARNIRRIFFFQGALIGVMGTALGVALGLGWCWLANTFRAHPDPRRHLPDLLRPVPDEAARPRHHRRRDPGHQPSSRRSSRPAGRPRSTPSWP